MATILDFGVCSHHLPTFDFHVYGRHHLAVGGPSGEDSLASRSDQRLHILDQRFSTTCDSNDTNFLKSC